MPFSVLSINQLILHFFLNINMITESHNHFSWKMLQDHQSQNLTNIVNQTIALSAKPSLEHLTLAVGRIFTLLLCGTHFHPCCHIPPLFVVVLCPVYCGFPKPHEALDRLGGFRISSVRNCKQDKREWIQTDWEQVQIRCQEKITSVRVVRSNNRLSGEVVNVPFQEVFNMRLDGALSSQRNLSPSTAEGLEQDNL